MSHVNATLAVSANRRGARSCTSNARSCTENESIVSFVKNLVPRKTWAFLSEKLGICERTAKHRLAGKREFTASELAVLLRQERGRELLVAIMGDAKPTWWVEVYRQFKIHDARKAALLAERDLQEAINAVDDTTAAIARTETALVLQDEEFHRPHVDALRSMAGVRNRTVAAATNRRGRG
jgi:hypothetical protein